MTHYCLQAGEAAEPKPAPKRPVVNTEELNLEDLMEMEEGAAEVEGTRVVSKKKLTPW